MEAILSQRLRADDFSMIKVIGRGAFGEVQLVSTLPDVTQVLVVLYVCDV